MSDSVLLCGDGNTCERAGVDRWFSQGKRTSPLTGACLEGDIDHALQLVPNMALPLAIYGQSGGGTYDNTYDVYHEFSKRGGL